MTQDPPGLPLDALLEWLAANVEDIDTSRSLEASLLTGGRSNLTYKVVDGAGRAWAVRRPPLGHVMPSAHDLGREARVLSGLGRGGYPVPAVRALCQDDAVIGVPFLVMDFIDGPVIADNADARRLTAPQADHVCSLLVESLARLHSLDAQAVGLGDFGRPGGYLARQVRRWGEQWSLSATREVPAMDVMAAWLTDQVSAIPADLPWSIVHGDFRLDNVILSPDLAEVRAVLDWEMSTLGDPVADLAVALVYWTEDADGLRGQVPVAQRLTAGPGFWTRSRIVDTYADLTGRDLAHLPFCLVLACYKLAVIMESLNFRNRMGMQLGRAAEPGEDTDAAVLALARLGEKLVDRPEVATLSS